MKKPTIPPEVLEFFKKAGAKGGKTRAKRHSKEQMAAWSRKGGFAKAKATRKKKGD